MPNNINWVAIHNENCLLKKDNCLLQKELASCATKLHRACVREAKLKGELDDLREENKEFAEQIEFLPNDMEDKWWDATMRLWRWDGDDASEDEEE
jgi:hypothetical protein